MPELPEVETMRRGILAVEGARIAAAVVPACRLKPIRIQPPPRTFQRRIAGQVVARVERRGKRLLLRLTDQSAIVFEPRMTGLVLIADPPNQTHLRFGLRFHDSTITAIWFWDRRGLGSVRWLPATGLADVLSDDRLGPDALELQPGELADRLFRCRREIKVALLDQRVVAGIGNIYASEILHRAGIHPRTRCQDLTRAQWPRLDQALQDVLAEAILYEGSTLGDGTYRNALNRDGSYQNHHRVYQHDRQLCGTCGRVQVQRIVQAQRSTFFCPACQPRRRA